MKIVYGRRRLPAFLLILAVSALSGQHASAARLLRYSIWIDGKVAMKASWGDNGRGNHDTVWAYWKRVALSPAEGFRIEADADEPSRMSLKGNIVLDAQYGGRAEIPELMLVKGNDGKWRVTPEVVDRTLKTRHRPFRFALSSERNRNLWTTESVRKGKVADTPANVWRELKQQTIYGARIEAGADDALHTVLPGLVAINMYYNGKPWGRAEISDLKLRRRTPQSLWTIEPAEVDRALQRFEDLSGRSDSP